MQKNITSLAASTFFTLFMGCGTDAAWDQTSEPTAQTQQAVTSCSSGTSFMTVGVFSSTDMTTSRTVAFLDVNGNVVTTLVVPAGAQSVKSTFCGNANYRVLDTAAVDNFSTTANYKGLGVALGTSDMFTGLQSFVLISPDTTNCAGYDYATGALISVEQVVPPALSLPTFAYAPPPSNPAAITYTASATNICGNSVAVTCSPASGSSFPTGATTVTCSATSSTRTATAAFIAYNPVLGYPSLSTSCGILLAGQGIPLGSTLSSCSGKYSLKMQGDSNLVLYNNQTGAALWATGVPKAIPSGVYMQGDGNLVTYGMLGSALWGSGTSGHNGANLNVQDDGNLVIYQNGNPIWATGTSGK